jgi:glyoxylase-like metal-dependent hydrolase (beta-lactamase superfamily II)
MQYHLLFPGTHRISKTSNLILPGHTSAVTLIQTKNDKNILVDTGSRGIFPVIENQLERLGLEADDIDTVILTHLHLDHAFNVALFPKAQIIAWMHEWKYLKTCKLKSINNYEIEPGVVIFPTPGHAEEHLAVEITLENDQKVIIAGDAIDKTYIKTKKVNRFFYDEKLYKKSANEIIKRANIIIPGHGEPITLDNY